MEAGFPKSRFVGLLTMIQQWKVRHGIADELGVQSALLLVDELDELRVETRERMHEVIDWLTETRRTHPDVWSAGVAAYGRMSGQTPLTSSGRWLPGEGGLEPEEPI